MSPKDQRSGERRLLEQVLREEAAAVEHLADILGQEFHDAVDLISACSGAGGTVLVSGLGKSGLIGAKLSATLASLGIPSHPVHPTEAAHGDLGRFRPTDAAICISNSGETDELINLAAALRQDGIPVIAITGEPPLGEPSSLARLARVALRLDITSEAGGTAAPTTSTTAALALGDALAIAAARRGHDSTDQLDAQFARRHPGGSLGHQLRPVLEVLRFRVGETMHPIPDDLSVQEALQRAEVPGRRPGAIVLIDRQTERVSGIFTDADLRRLLLRERSALLSPMRDVMTRNPRCLTATDLVRDAVRMVREHRADEIPVVDEAGRPVGLLDVQDLVTMRLVKGAS